MTTYEIRELAKEFEVLSDEKLAKEFVARDRLVLKYWEHTPDDLSDEHQILQDIIIERFVKKANIGLVWNDEAQKWVSPDWNRDKDIQVKRIDYWIEV